MDAVFMGVSQSRNPNLAAVFYRLGLVESYGTGVRRILHSYHNFAPSPVFQSAEGAFTVALFNRNEAQASASPVPNRQSQSASAPFLRDDTKAAILALAKGKGKVTRKEIELAFEIGTTKAYSLLKALCDEGALIQRKNGKQTTYVPK